MNSRADFCPGCGAQVYPEEAHCPFCGRKLRTSVLLPFMVGLGGTTVALAAGALVWWMMAAPTAQPTPQAQADVPAASTPQAAAPTGAGKDQQALMPAGSASPQSAAPPTADTKEAALPLPTVSGPITPPPADANARRAFAKAKQESFAQNGLDLTVSTSGEEATILTIKFNFPAKTAAELIVAGPFPKQCEQRGFRQVLFVDPAGPTWIYDVATRQMTQK